MRKGKRVRIEQLEDRYQSCAGIDVHKQSLSVCVIAPGDATTVEAEVRQYGTTTRELLRLSAWLLECGVEATVLESTGVYWKPVWQVLEGEGLEVILANAKAVKNFPGKKTDTEDSVWLATLLRKGLVRANLIPSAEVRALRELCRSRVSLVRDRTRVVQRIDKVLQEANIKLSSVVSDVMGVSAQQMMRRMAAGDTDAARLADLALGRLRSKIPELVPALEGRFVEHQRFLLTELLEQYDYLTAKIGRFEKEAEARLDPFEAQLGRVMEMPGFDRLSAAMVLAEIGFDITAFPSAGHLCSWATVCPGNRETGGKRLSGKTRKGNGASENATVVGELLDDLVERAVDFSVPMLYVLDGSKALRKAVRKHAGSQALLQRCQLHKRRNVTAHLPEPYRNAVERKMINAYQMAHYDDAKKALQRLHRELMELNPSAARSLEEGMEETLTVHRLKIDGLLRLTLTTTNPIESAFSTVDRICSRVKCWRRGDHRERWVGAGLWLAERSFRRVKGYKQLPQLLAELAKLDTPPPAQARVA